jgi:trans-aconitate methyltransferase
MLHQTFGEDAELYDRVRPTYPPDLYDDIAELLGNPDQVRVLEIGSGTGLATAPMVERGWSVTAVELSPDMARVAQAKLPDVEVIVADFDSWVLPAASYDLVISATAFHWLDRRPGSLGVPTYSGRAVCWRWCRPNTFSAEACGCSRP